MKILLIAGHGAGDPGACANVNGRDYREADLTREVVQAINNHLYDKASVAIYPTERNCYADVRSGTASNHTSFGAYDYVLEIHFNASSLDEGDGRTKGCECYVTTSEGGTGVESAICQKLSELGYTNRGVKRYNWAVINTAKRAGASSALLEVCFVDDADDMLLYDADKVGRAIAHGVCEGFGLSWTEENSANANENSTNANITERGELDMTKDELMSTANTGDNPSGWAQEATRWAVEQGVINGDGNGNYGWQAPMTREALAQVLYNFAEKHGLR